MLWRRPWVTSLLAAISVAGGAETLTVEDSTARFAINASTGQMLGGWLKSPQRKLIEQSLDLYHLRQDAAAPEVVTGEGLDAVTRVTAKTRSTVTLTCGNARFNSLGVVKSYRVNKGVLAKRVAIQSANAEPMFLRVITRTNPTAKMLDGGYYFQLRPAHIGGAAGRALVRPEDCVSGRAHMAHTITLTNRNLNACAGQYVYGTNGHFVYAPYRDWGWMYDTFWEIENTFEGFLRSGEEASYETHLGLTNGDQGDFYAAYCRLPEYVRMRQSQSDPGWIDRVKFVADCGYLDYGYDKKNWAAEVSLKYFNQLLDEGDNDAFCLNTFSWAMFPGYVPFDEPFSVGPDKRGGQRAPWQLKADIAFLRTVVPKAKLALYYWRASFDETLPPFAGHPEWIAYDEKGEKQKGSFQEGQWQFKDVLPNLNARSYLDFQMQQVDALTDFYGGDYLYLDGGNEMIGYPDWKSKTYVHGYQFMDYSAMMRRSGSKIGERPIFMNAPNAPLGSMYYWEGCGDWQKDNSNYWRGVGERLLITKMLQHGRRWTAPLSWTHASDGDPWYANYLVGLGLKPARLGPPPLPQIRCPFIKAAFEMRHLQYDNAKFKPCFWRGDDTGVEAYCLRQGATRYFSLISHTRAATRARLTCALSEIGLSARKPVFVWEIRIRDPRDYPQDLYEKLKELWARKEFPDDPALTAQWKERRVSDTGLAAVYNAQPEGLFAHEVELRPNLLTMLAPTHCPAAVYAIGGRRTQTVAPSLADAELDFIHFTRRSKRPPLGAGAVHR